MSRADRRAGAANPQRGGGARRPGLPDPERTISRVHAQVVYRNGRYAIVDRGSNPISVNGRPLGNGQEALIQAGDEIQIGGYAMRVEAGGAPGGAAAADPFADFPGLA